MKAICLITFALVEFALSAPQFGFQAPPPGTVQFGVDSSGCLVGPSGKVCPTGPTQFTSGAEGFAAPEPPRTSVQHQSAVHHQPAHHHHSTFTGLVGPSGVIGPSGLVGPAGPVHFG